MMHVLIRIELVTVNISKSYHIKIKKALYFLKFCCLKDTDPDIFGNHLTWTVFFAIIGTISDK